MQQRFALEVSGEGSQWRFEPGRTGLIGREATADILLSDIHVSRRHAEIRDTGTGWVIVDVGSRHGLWWNSQRVPQVEVHGPTTIRLGGAGGVELRMTPVPASGGGTGGGPGSAGSDSGGQFAGAGAPGAGIPGAGGPGGGVPGGGVPGGGGPGGQTPGAQPPGGPQPVGPVPGGPPGSGPGAPTPPGYGSPQQPVMPPAASGPQAPPFPPGSPVPPGQMPGQLPPGQLPGQVPPPGSVPPGSVPPPGSVRPGQMPPGQVPPGGMMPPGQMPPGAVPPGAMPPGGPLQGPPGPGQMAPPGPVPPGQGPLPGQMPPPGPPGGQVPPPGQMPPGQVPQAAGLQAPPAGGPGPAAPFVPAMPGGAPSAPGVAPAMQTVLGGQAMQQQQQRGPRRVAPPIPSHLTRVRVGREADNDLILDDLLVSRHHAVLDRTPQGWVVTDIGSRNGTFVNGHRVSGTLPLAEGETLGFGQLSYRVERGLLQPVVPKLDNAFAAVDLSVRVESGKLLLQNMGFTLPHGSLIGVIGPSGAGKSTLLGALTGMRPATVGTVLIDGRDLYAHYEEMRRRIGFVPQQDILHPQLNVRRALRYAAELRFPDDVSRQERERRVEEVIQELGLAQQSDLRIDKLSGGQRKRVSVAMELLTAPSTLFLDEPTSGLDPGLDKQVMQTLRHLADGGRTVLVVTHSVANLHLCDRVLVLAPGGRMAFFGPPQQVLPHFGATDYADVFISLQRDPEGCEARFRQSQWANQLGLEQVRQELTSHRGMTAANTAPAPSRQQSWLSQTLTLTRRYAAVSLADRMFGVLLLAMPVVLALISRIIPAENGLHTLPNKSPMMLLLVLVMGGVLTGVMMSIREIVKEKPIFHRESSVGLSVTAYGTSKLIFLGIVMVIQTVIMVVLALVGRKGVADSLILGGTPEIMLAILAVTLCAMVTGLAISALVDTSDKSTIALIPYVILQLVFSGAIIEVAGKAGVEQFAWLWPSRWGLGATAASVDGLCGTSKPVRTPTGIDICGHPTKPDSLWDHKASTWFGDMTMLGVLTALLTVVLFMLLIRQGPHRRKGIG